MDYSNYTYYKGETECPFYSGKRMWWRIESYAAQAGDKKAAGELSDAMIEFIRERVWQSDSGWDTDWETALKRAKELYRKGLWSASYISERDITIDKAF